MVAVAVAVEACSEKMKWLELRIGDEETLCIFKKRDKYLGVKKQPLAEIEEYFEKRRREAMEEGEAEGACTSISLVNFALFRRVFSTASYAEVDS